MEQKPIKPPQPPDTIVEYKGNFISSSEYKVIKIGNNIKQRKKQRILEKIFFLFNFRNSNQIYRIMKANFIAILFTYIIYHLLN